MDLSRLMFIAGGVATAALLSYSHIGMEKSESATAHYFGQGRAPEDMNFDYYEILDKQQSREVQQFRIVQSFASDLLANIKDLDPEFSKVVDDHFWDLA